MVRSIVLALLLVCALRAAPAAGADGTPDSSFGTGGAVISTFGFAQCGAESLVRQPDGKLVVAGFVGDYPAVATGFLLARYNADGSLDPSFGTGGRVTTTGGETTARDLLLQPDGKLIAIGYGGFPGPVQIRLVRYESNGSIDMTFGTGGKVTANFTGGSVPARACCSRTARS
jgi:uncharacterized delta-60 repeat protein